MTSTFSRMVVTVGLMATLTIGGAGCTPDDDQTNIDYFNSLAREPDRALDMLYPDGVVEPGTSTEAIRLIRDNEWTDNEFDALANMLDAAATAHRTQDDPRAELSALAATDTVNLFAKRESGKLPDTVGDSIGHIVANYIVDVNFVAAVNDTPETYDNLNSQFYVNLPPGARFSLSSLRTVLPQIMSDERGAEQIIDATNHLFNARVATNISPGNADADRLKTDAIFVAQLVGFVIGGAVTSDDSSPEWTTSVANSLAATTAAAPAPGTTFADYITTQAKQLGQTYTPSSAPPLTVDPSPSGVDNANLLVGVVTTALADAVGILLGQAGLLNQQDDADPLPWFVDNKFDADLARQYPDRFENYLGQGYPDWAGTTHLIRLTIQAQVQFW